MRRLLYNSKGTRQEKFVLVELPNILYVGFYWTLKDLQRKSASEQELAFIGSIAPSIAGLSPEVSIPEYATMDDFAFQLDSIRKKGDTAVTSSLTLKPKEVISNDEAKDQAVNDLCRETTLDHGQATALCENLCRGFAFTQGPPGTGKTYVVSEIPFLVSFVDLPQFSRCCSDQGAARIARPQFAKTDPSSMHDKSCSRQLFKRHPTSRGCEIRPTRRK